MPLGNIPYTIDTVEVIEDYRDIIILYISSGRIARDMVTTLLISRFFFIVDLLLENTVTPFWYCGSVYYKGPARMVILALENLYPNRLSYILDYRLIDRFRGLDSLYPLYRYYSRSVTFLACHLEYKVNIYFQTSSKKR